MSRKKCHVGVLPTLHSYHEDPEFRHYDYNALSHLVLAFHPDIICGEVRPTDWMRTRGGKKDGYCGPVEYRKCLLPLCQEHGIRFEPVDSYDDADVKLADAGDTSSPEAQLTQIVLSLAKRKELGVGALIDPALIYAIRAKHALALQNRPEIESRTWNRRNEMIAHNIRRVVSRNLTKHILVAIGLEHVPFVSDLLSAIPMIDLIPAFNKEQGLREL